MSLSPFSLTRFPFPSFSKLLVLRLAGTAANGSLPQVRKGKGKGKEADLSENVENPGARRGEVPSPRRSIKGDVDELVRSTAAASEFSADSPVSTLLSILFEHPALIFDSASLLFFLRKGHTLSFVFDTKFC